MSVANGEWYLRIKSIYKSNSLSIVASENGTPRELQNAQAIVDATGKATDVLRRIQVRLSISGIAGNRPEFPIHSLGSLCKRVKVHAPNNASIDTASIPPGETNCNNL